MQLNDGADDQSQAKTYERRVESKGRTISHRQRLTRGGWSPKAKMRKGWLRKKGDRREGRGNKRV